MRTTQADVLIIGGGLAGLCAAIDLARAGYEVLLFEPKAYPRHKVCGEYISNEVLPYLKSLGFDPFDHGAVAISNFLWTHPDGRSISARLPLGGFGLSRYTAELELFNLAKAAGVSFITEAVVAIQSEPDGVTAKTSSGKLFYGQTGIGAYGKRSVLDKKLAREFIDQKANFMAAKWHARGSFDSSLVALHNFKGGYCGVSRVEEGLINFCFIATYDVFKKHKNLNEFINLELASNPALKELLDQTDMQFEQPISIAQISFKDKPPVEAHWLMCGDTAGLIHPLSGNGMSMAIRSASLAASELKAFLKGTVNRKSLMVSYENHWKSEFNKRLRMGRIAARVFASPKASSLSLQFLKLIPGLLPFFIRQTHGKLKPKHLHNEA